MRRQGCFHLGEAGRVYLSPYTDIFLWSGKKLLLCRCDTGAKVVLECSAVSAFDQIITALSEGIGVSELAELIGTEQFVEICKAKGVIE